MLARGCLSGDGLQLLGPSSIPGRSVGLPEELWGRRGFQKGLCCWSEEVSFKPKPSVELGGRGVSGPGKEAHLVFGMRLLPLYRLSLASVLNDSWGGVLLRWWGTVLF